MLPILIIGQGLAGTALAWRLTERGVPFLIVDRHQPITSSKIAAGLITPITGMRLSLSWRYDALYPAALAFYRGIEQTLGRTFFHSTPIVRLLGDAKAADLWARRRLEPQLQAYLDPTAPDPVVDPAVFANPHGAFQQRHSGWLDTATYLEASRLHFADRGQWQPGSITHQDLILDPSSVTWRGRAFSTAIFCVGWEAAEIPWFDWVPFQSARGAILTLQSDVKGERRIISRGNWILPREDGSLRAGSSYEWDFTDPQTSSPAALAGLENNLHRLFKTPFHVTATQTAVRPIIKGREALLGRHPARPQIAFLNGLGSKGAVRSPWLAEQLVAHLLDGQPIEADLDLAGNL